MKTLIIICVLIIWMMIWMIWIISITDYIVYKKDMSVFPGVLVLTLLFIVYNLKGSKEH